MRRVLESGLFVLALSVAAAQAPNDGLAQANSALQAGEADKALSLISSLPVSAESRNLRCRVLFTIEHWDEAVYECEQAVRLDGQSSTNHMWYGRALGEKADRATFLTAYSLAKRVKAEFEEATRLNPRNAEALADLSEFYISAPGVVGGGIDKAESVAAQMEKLDAARGHELRGAIAQSRKDYGTAEGEFKQLRAGRLAGFDDVIVQAAERFGPAELGPYDLGADSALADQQSFLDQLLNSLTGGGPGKAQPAGERQLVFQAITWGQRTGVDGVFDGLRKLVVEGDRGVALEGDVELTHRGRFCHVGSISGNVILSEQIH